MKNVFVSIENRISTVLENGRVAMEKYRLFHVYRNVAFLSTYEDKNKTELKFPLK